MNTFVQPLESRRLLSSVILAPDGALTVSAGGNIRIGLSADAASVELYVNSDAAQTFAVGDVKSVAIRGGNRGDTITVDETNGVLGVGLVISGGNGRDTIYGGSGNDIIYGGNGRDMLYGGAGNDYLSGGNGRDLIYGGDGNDSLYGGNGKDVLLGGAGDDLLNGGRGKNLLDPGESSPTRFTQNGHAVACGGHAREGVDCEP